MNSAAKILNLHASLSSASAELARQHADKFSDLANQTRELANLPNLHPVAREALNRAAASLSVEAVNIRRVTQ